MKRAQAVDTLSHEEYFAALSGGPYLVATADGLLVDIDQVAHTVAESAVPTPDLAIEHALQTLGVPGTYTTSRTVRQLWYLCVHRFGEIRRTSKVDQAQRAADFSARVLWEAFDSGLSQAEAAARLGISRHSFSVRRLNVGFQVDRHGKILWGPCLGCDTPLPLEQLDPEHRCSGCGGAFPAARRSA